MANIRISNLKPNGYDLFSDSESYMMNLSDHELNDINGGISTTPFCISILVGFTVSAAGASASIGYATAG